MQWIPKCLLIPTHKAHTGHKMDKGQCLVICYISNSRKRIHEKSSNTTRWLKLGSVKAKINQLLERSWHIHEWWISNTITITNTNTRKVIVSKGGGKAFQFPHFMEDIKQNSMRKEDSLKIITLMPHKRDTTFVHMIGVGNNTIIIIIIINQYQDSRPLHSLSLTGCRPIRADTWVHTPKNWTVVVIRLHVPECRNHHYYWRLEQCLRSTTYQYDTMLIDLLHKKLRHIDVNWKRISEKNTRIISINKQTPSSQTQTGTPQLKISILWRCLSFNIGFLGFADFLYNSHS